MIFATRRPASSSISNWVITGPVSIWTTRTWQPNSSRVFSRSRARGVDLRLVLLDRERRRRLEQLERRELERPVARDRGTRPARESPGGRAGTAVDRQVGPRRAAARRRTGPGDRAADRAGRRLGERSSPAGSASIGSRRRLGGGPCRPAAACRRRTRAISWIGQTNRTSWQSARPTSPSADEDQEHPGRAELAFEERDARSRPR